MPRLYYVHTRMNESIDPTPTTSSTDGSQHPYKPLSTMWRLTLLGAPSLLAEVCLLATLIGGNIVYRYVPGSALESIITLWFLITVPCALIGSIFAVYDLLKSLNPTSSVNPFAGLFLWIGVLMVNGFMTFAMCIATLNVASKLASRW